MSDMVSRIALKCRRHKIIVGELLTMCLSIACCLLARMWGVPTLVWLTLSSIGFLAGMISVWIRVA